MADHKETITSDLTVERVKSIALLAGQLFAAVQTALSIAGVTALPYTSDQVSAAVTGVITVGLSVWAWWRSNPVTEAGLTGAMVTRAIKADAMETKTVEPADTDAADPAVTDIDDVPEASDEELDLLAEQAEAANRDTSTGEAANAQS